MSEPKPILNLKEITGPVDPRLLHLALISEDGISWGRVFGTRDFFSNGHVHRIVAERLGHDPSAPGYLLNMSLRVGTDSETIFPHNSPIGIEFYKFNGEPTNVPRGFRFASTDTRGSHVFVDIRRHPTERWNEPLGPDVRNCLTRDEIEAIISPDETEGVSELIYNSVRLSTAYLEPGNARVDSVHFRDVATGELRLKGVMKERLRLKSVAARIKPQFIPVEGDTTINLGKPVGRFVIPGVITEAEFVERVLFAPRSPVIDYKTGKIEGLARFNNYFGIRDLEDQWEREKIHNW